VSEVKKAKKPKMKWVNLKDAPPQMTLDGLRIRYKKHTLGYIRSAWNRGIWLADSVRSNSVLPWFPPNDMTLADIADDIQVELRDE
jgi:hypothetical protein